MQNNLDYPEIELWLFEKGYIWTSTLAWAKVREAVGLPPFFTKTT